MPKWLQGFPLPVRLFNRLLKKSLTDFFNGRLMNRRFTNRKLASFTENKAPKRILFSGAASMPRTRVFFTPLLILSTARIPAFHERTGRQKLAYASTFYSVPSWVPFVSRTSLVWSNAPASDPAARCESQPAHVRSTVHTPRAVGCRSPKPGGLYPTDVEGRKTVR